MMIGVLYMELFIIFDERLKVKVKVKVKVDRYMSS